MATENESSVTTTDKKRKFSLKRTALMSVVSFLVVYYGIMFCAQRWLIYPSSLAPTASRKVPPGIEKITLPLDEGGEVYAWFQPAPGASAESPAPLVIYFHGNAEIVDQHGNLRDFYNSQGVSVLMPEYRGYGHCDGHPSQERLRNDHMAFYDMMVGRPDVDGSRVVFHGRSLGGGIAADLASQRECTGLILESTFASIPAMAARYFVPGFFVLDPYRTDLVVSSAEIPVLIMHGSEDRTIPVENGRTLSTLAKHGRYEEFEGVGHNNLPEVNQQQRYDDSLRWLLEQAGAKKSTDEISPTPDESL